MYMCMQYLTAELLFAFPRATLGICACRTYSMSLASAAVEVRWSWERRGCLWCGSFVDVPFHGLNARPSSHM